jgi:hypothetical protein
MERRRWPGHVWLTPHTCLDQPHGGYSLRMVKDPLQEGIEVDEL